MSDETPSVVQESHEWYHAFKNGKSLGEGLTPIPDEIREIATEIRWSNPSTDKTFAHRPAPISSAILQQLKAQPVIEHTLFTSDTDAPNMERTEPVVSPDQNTDN